MGSQSVTNMSVILLAMVMVSALSVVFVKYDSRLKFNQLKKEFREQDRLGVEWGRLQLEQNTWSTNNRIEKIARATLGLQAPTSQQLVYVKVK